MKRIAVATTTLALAATGTGAGIAAAAHGSAAKPTILPVTMNEFHFLPARRSVRAGKVTFVVRNAGKIAHELVLIRTSKPAGKLAAGGEASEQGAVGETGDVAAGKTRDVTLTLKKGHYALVCNLPGHYKAGMYLDFTVL